MLDRTTIGIRVRGEFLLKLIKKWRKSHRMEKKERMLISAMREIQIENLREKLKATTTSGERKDKNIAIYSTFCGPARAMSLSVPVHEIAADFYFISNNPVCLGRAKKLGWIPFHLKIDIFDDPIISSHQAKIAKALPHFFEFLCCYEKIFYMDDKFRFDKDILQALSDNFSDMKSGFLVRYHPFLSGNVMFELAEAMGQSRYFAQREKTVRFIINKLDSGCRLQMQKMYDTGLIMRDPNNTEVQKINEEWYLSILECGIECQISFNFIAQKYPGIVGFDAQSLGLIKK